MKNVETLIENNTLVIRVDLTQTFGPSKSGKTIIVASSKSGKTIIVASTEGNVTLPGGEKLGLLNVYRAK